VDTDRVPRELRTRLKKAHGARGLLEQLEKEVREFILGAGVRGQAEEEDDAESEYEDSVNAEEDSEEDEIVFVSKRARGIVGEVKKEETREKVLFQGVEGDKSASFG
jgi:hypothetical protein